MSAFTGHVVTTGSPSPARSTATTPPVHDPGKCGFAGCDEDSVGEVSGASSSGHALLKPGSVRWSVRVCSRHARTAKQQFRASAFAETLRG